MEQMVESVILVDTCSSRINPIPSQDSYSGEMKLQQTKNNTNNESFRICSDVRH